MSDVTEEQVIDYLSGLKVTDLVALTSQLEAQWGVKAQAAIAVGPAPVTETVEEQTEFKVILKSFGEKKIPVIKEVRQATGLGLKDAKTLVDSAPATVKEGLSKEDATDLVRKITAAGGEAISE